MSSKENDVLIVGPDLTSSSMGARPGDTSTTRPQPVALEVPVTVNGARTVEGSDKREPFSEMTKTVLVFGNGAVIRLGSPVAAGQLLFLTNEKTKKEVVCQVVKSKNYRSVSGYVELEFTEQVVGFWGMRFPSDKPAAPAAVRPAPVSPVATGNPVAPVPPVPRPVSPVVAATPKFPEAKPVAVEPPASLPVLTTAPTPVVSARAIPVAPAAQALPEAPAAKVPEPPVTHAAGLSSSLATSLANLLGEETPAPPAPESTSTVAALPQSKTPPPSSSESAELKLQTARLQEQLSSLLFSSAPAPNMAERRPDLAAPDAKTVSNVAAQVLEIAKADVSVPPASPAKPTPAPVKSALDTEEVKIPAWLEPLARNAAAPASTQELVEREKAKHAVDRAPREEAAEQPVAITAVEPVSSAAADLPPMPSLLPLDESILAEASRERGSRKGLVFGAAAAAVLIIAGGAWYFLQPARSPQNPAAPLATSANSHSQVPAGSVQPAQQPLSAAPNVQPSAQGNVEPSKPSSVGTSQPPASPVNAQPASGTTISNAAGSQTASVVRESGRAASSPIPAAEKERITRSAPAANPEPEPKKPSLGEVHLASPMMNRRTASQNDGDAAPTLGTDVVAPGAGGLSSGLGSGKAAGPQAPLAVGGDVIPARLLSSVSPVYPAIAKNQHISGDVVIDALIDANGRVTTMKVLSGPALLYQAAMDALRQWKYQAASLDGNPVAMHLTVKLQFRIQ